MCFDVSMSPIAKTLYLMLSLILWGRNELKLHNKHFLLPIYGVPFKTNNTVSKPLSDPFSDDGYKQTNIKIYKAKPYTA